MAIILKKFNSLGGFSVGDETPIDVVDANANVSANYLSVGNNLAVTGDANITGNTSITGNLTVLGAVSYIQTTTTYVSDPLTETGGGPNGAPLASNDNADRGSVLHYYTGNIANGAPVDAFIGWDNSNAEFALASNVVVNKTTNTVAYNQFGNIRLGNIITTGDISTGGNITIDGNINITGSISSSGGGAAINGNAIPLGEPYDGNLTSPGALDNWSNTTTVTDAIDDLNEVMLNVVKNTFVGNVDFTANVVSGPSPLIVSFGRTFNGTGTDYLWDFGDTTTSTSSTPTKTYANTSGGTFTVTLTVSNSSGLGAGASDNKVKTNYIRLYTPTPIPSFTLDKTATDTGGSVALTNTSQYADSYVIYWGDGTSDTIASNAVAGGVGGGAKSHTYAVTGSADTRYQPYIEAISTNAGPSPVTVASSTQNVYVYKTHSPTFTTSTLEGNNDYTLTPDGWNVTFTNTTAAGVGATTTFAGNYYKWTWGDGTTTSVNSGSGSAGDRSVDIIHKFSLTNPAVTETFTVKLEVYNGYSTSPFSSSTVTVTVHPDPQSIFTGNLVTLSDRTGDSSQTGYYFTDLNGTNRAIVRFTNSSLNTDSYKWTWGDGSNSGVITSGAGTPGSTIDHTFTSVGNYTIELLATGTYSESASDDTNTKTNYISINAAPAAPAGLSSKTLSMSTASVGTSPFLAALATDNSGGNIPAAGTSVTRYTTGTVVTSTLSDVYNSYTGTLTNEFNGVDDGAIAFTSSDNAGTYGNLVVTLDRDAHVPSPATYPSDFYKVFSAYATKTISSVSTGYNQIKLTHSTTGNTNPVGFVKDDLTSVPTVDVSGATLTIGTAGTYLYISGVPYFNTGSPTVSLAGAQIYDWIGQTYRNTTTPFTIAPDTNDESTTGNVIVSQTKTYSNLDGATTFLATGIPKADTGKNSSNKYTIGSQSINVAPASTAAVQTIKYSATNVNGTSATATVATKIQVFTSTPTGFVETSIPYGATTAKRIVISGATGANPTYNNATNYYLNNAWSGAVTIAGTDEAVVRWNQLKWFNTNLSTGYLPVGPNLNSGRTSGNQYFRGAFSKTLVQNFRVTITGKISGLFFAVPGTTIDTASTLNGWIDASITYDGAGVPGAGAGGNGSNGCASTPGDRVPLGSVISGTTYNMTLGSVSTGTAISGSTGNQVLFSIVLASGDYITSWSFS
jgi:PKD repeat protein